MEYFLGITVLANDAVLTESLGVLVISLKALHEQFKPLGHVPWPNTYRLIFLEAYWTNQDSLFIHVART